MTDYEVKLLERMRYDTYEARNEETNYDLYDYYTGQIDAIDMIEKMFGVTIEQIRNAQ